jgi:threonine dehydrogenase-like Zn-dependent dehydrogenase
MRATVMFGAGNVRVENVPNAQLTEPTDALVRVTRACICGSDLWPYKELAPTATGRAMGHEAIEMPGRAKTFKTHTHDLARLLG